MTDAKPEDLVKAPLSLIQRILEKHVRAIVSEFEKEWREQKAEIERLKHIEREFKQVDAMLRDMTGRADWRRMTTGDWAKIHSALAGPAVQPTAVHECSCGLWPGLTTDRLTVPNKGCPVHGTANNQASQPPAVQDGPTLRECSDRFSGENAKLLLQRAQRQLTQGHDIYKSTDLARDILAYRAADNQAATKDRIEGEVP